MSSTTARIGRHIPELDGLRGIAIGLVMLFHFAVYADLYAIQVAAEPGSAVAWIKQIIFSGWVGVDLFFVLSGFLITGILFDAKGRQKYFQRFYVRRTLRIFPLYFLALALWAAFASRYEPANAQTDPNAWAWLVTYTVNWLEGFKGNDAIPLGLQHFWTLAIEEQFYLVWPVVVLLCSRRALTITCFGLLIACPLLRFVLVKWGMILAAWAWTPCRLDGLAGGALAWLLLPWLSGQTARLRLLRVFLFMVTICLAGLFYSAGGFRGDNPPITIFGVSGICLFFSILLMLTVGSSSARIGNRLLRIRSLRWLGQYSYGLYVFHHPVAVYLAGSGLLAALIRTWAGGLASALLLVFLLPFVISCGLAITSWFLIEQPFLRLRSRFAGAA